MAELRTLLDLIDKFAPEIQAAFLVAFENVRDDAIIGKIIDAITAGDIATAVKFTGLSEQALRPLTAAIEVAFEAGGVFTANQFYRPVSQAVFRFNVRNSRAEAYLRDYSSQLVTRITNEQTDLIRNFMQQGMTEGINPRQIALDLIGRIDPVTGKRVGGVIGLTPQQAQWVSNMRTDLETLDERYFTRELRDKRFDPTVRRAIDSGTLLPSETVDSLITRYDNSLLRLRGETIGRTEALTSLNKSQDEAVKQLIDSGSVRQSQVKGEWDSSGNDGRTRETHLEMEGQQRGMDEPFVSPSGARLMFPGDSSLGAPPEEIINCRCRKKLIIDWLADVRGTL